MMHLTPTCKLVNYTGNYDQFVQTKKELEVNQMKKYSKEQEDIKHIKAFIASCGTYSNLVRQAQSKQKIIDKMEAAGLTEKVVESQQYHFEFPFCEKLPPPILMFQKVGFAYSGDMNNGALYDGLELGVDMDSRIALVGPNGAGKSTLLKLMLEELKPTNGEIRKHLDLSIGRYDQHSNDQLDASMCPLDFIRKVYADKNLEEQEWRSYLGRFGVSGTMQKQPIGCLSDGQKSRVVFAMIAVTRPNLLLLDEPTNHLDMECIDALARAINSFNGGVVLVSHDFRLIDQVAKQIWICDNHTIHIHKGDIRSYKKELITKMKKAQAATK
jgi:ATP-binding cassette subfamily F protein 2